MNKFCALLLAVILITLCLSPIVSAEGYISFKLTPPSTVRVGEIFNLKIDIATLPGAISAFELTLDFDPTKAIPQVTDNSNLQMNSFITVNRKNFDQYCRYDEDHGCYYLRFCAAPDSSGSEQQIDSTSDLSLSIPFAAAAEGVIEFDTREIMAFDAKLNMLPCLDTHSELVSSPYDAVYSVGMSVDAFDGGITTLDAVITNIGKNSLTSLNFDIAYSAVAPRIAAGSEYITSSPSGFASTVTASSGRLSVNITSSGGARLKQGESIRLSIPLTVTGNESERCEFTASAFGGSDTSSGKAFGVAKQLRVMIGASRGFSFTDAGISESNGFILGIKPGMTIAELQNVCQSQLFCSSETLYTGCTVTLKDGRSARIVIKGDIDGNGSISANDYLMLKRIFLGTLSPTDVQMQAARITGNDITPLDCYAIKLHALGRYDIFS